MRKILSSTLAFALIIGLLIGLTACEKTGILSRIPFLLLSTLLTHIIDLNILRKFLTCQYFAILIELIEGIDHDQNVA